MEEAAAYQGGVWEMMWEAGLMVKLVLVILLFASVISWAIIVYKVRLMRRVERETEAFYELFWKVRDFSQVSKLCKNYGATPLSSLFTDAYEELEQMEKSETVRESPAWRGEELVRLGRVLKRTSAVERVAMEKSINFLATTGNTAPFIGLFGTVWGIMNTFRDIGVTGTASLAVVAPGISEALIATAMGLFAAIPAVVGYNHLLTRINRVASAMSNFCSDLTNIIERHLTKDPE